MRRWVEYSEVSAWVRLGFLKQEERPSPRMKADGRDIHFSSANDYYDWYLYTFLSSFLEAVAPDVGRRLAQSRSRT
jgi:hypothetical protein